MDTQEARSRLEARRAELTERQERVARHTRHRDEPLSQDFAEQAVEAAPRDVVTLVGAGRLFEQLRKPRRAMKTAQKATEVGPQDPQAWRLLLDLCEKADNWHTAVRAAERLLALDPKDKSMKDRLKRAKREAK